MLQKTLSARELRVCFEDPEWEQLITQLLGKATQVIAVKPPPMNLSQVSGNQIAWNTFPPPGPLLGVGCRKALGCSQGCLSVGLPL
jgi:hypothetical protein